MAKSIFNPLVNKEMTRKEFLIFWGTLLVALVPVVALLKKLEEDLFAASPWAESEAESGSLTNGAKVVTNSAASAGEYVQFGNAASSGGTAGFGQPIMSPPNGSGLKGTYLATAGSGAGQMFWQDTFQTGSLNPNYWRNTMGSVSSWGNEPQYGSNGGLVSVAPASSGGGVTLDNSASGPSSCMVTCEPVGTGSVNLVKFPAAGFFIQWRMKVSDMTQGFFPAVWMPPEGGGEEIDFFEGGFLGGPPVNQGAHQDFGGSNSAGNYQDTIASIGVDLTQNWVTYGVEWRPNVSLKFYMNNQLTFTAGGSMPSSSAYNVAVTPQNINDGWGGGSGWHSTGSGTGKMYISEFQAYMLP